MGQYKGKGAVLRVEHERILQTHPQRHGRAVLGAFKRGSGTW
jgi:hypothetical protein